MCHLAGAAPFLVACAFEMSRGWRPTGDDANITFRSWDVLSSHSPLVGQFSQAAVSSGRPIYDLGPLLYWFLTIPVHLDHNQGALLGATILCVVAVSLAIEAAWSVRGWPASVAVVAIVLTVVAVYPRVALDPTWNPDVGLIWFISTAALAWAVAAGHLRWWPVLVVVGSFSAQSHLMFSLGSIACVVVAPVIGVLRRSFAELPGRKVGWWLPSGVLIGIACWVAPIIEQITTHPGNLTLLARFHGSERPNGAAFGLRSLAAAVGPVPVWTGHPSVTDPFTLFNSIQSHASLDGVIILLGLCVIGVVAWITKRRDLAAAAAIVLLLSLAVVWTLASLPYGSLTISYIDTSSWPVGMAVVLVVAWAVVELAVAASRSLAHRHGEHRYRPSRSTTDRKWAVVLGAVIVALGAYGVLASTVTGSGVGNAAEMDDLWTTVAQVQYASNHIEQVVPRGRVKITTESTDDGQNALDLYGVSTGVVWQLYADGWHPETTLALSTYSSPVVAPGRTVPPVTATIIGGNGSTVRVLITHTPSAKVP